MRSRDRVPGVRWTVSENTVADSMRRQGLQGRKSKRRKRTTKQGKTAPKFSGSAQARLHRASGACEVLRRHDRDPDRLNSEGRRNTGRYARSSKAVSRSAGVSQLSVLRGRVLSCSATA